MLLFLLINGIMVVYEPSKDLRITLSDVAHFLVQCEYLYLCGSCALLYVC